LAGAWLLEGDSLIQTIAFFDPGADNWTAEIDYGDGLATGPVPLEGDSVNLNHVYRDEGIYTITIRVAVTSIGLFGRTASA
jgi:hypothetical protein